MLSGLFRPDFFWCKAQWQWQHKTKGTRILSARDKETVLVLLTQARPRVKLGTLLGFELNTSFEGFWRHTKKLPLRP